MKVERMPLPGAATVVVFGCSRRVLVDTSLSRDDAALAITGVLPDVHPDVVDHWLDTAFERRRLPFTARQVAMTVGVLAALVGMVGSMDMSFSVSPADPRTVIVAPALPG